MSAEQELIEAVKRLHATRADVARTQRLARLANDLAERQSARHEAAQADVHRLMELVQP